METKHTHAQTYTSDEYVEKENEQIDLRKQTKSTMSI